MRSSTRDYLAYRRAFRFVFLGLFITVVISGTEASKSSGDFGSISSSKYATQSIGKETVEERFWRVLLRETDVSDQSDEKSGSCPSSL